MNNFIVDGVEIPFEHDWNIVAVSVSGGADSALLTYLLCNYISEHNLNTDILILSHIRMWKTRPWQKYNSLDVYRYLSHNFKNIHFTRYENFIPPALEWGNTGPTLTDEYGKSVSGDIIEIQSFAEYICTHENADAYFNAVTHNPRSVDLGGMTKRDVEPDETNQHLRLTRHMGKVVSHPFRFIEKDWVIRQYKRLQLDSLLNLTRSCEGEFPEIDYTTYELGQQVPVCGECFWCKEREWAIQNAK